MEVIYSVVSGFITIFSLGLLFITLLSYKKYKNAKLIFVCSVFLVFLVKGILLSVHFLIVPLTEILLYSMLGDLVIVVLLFLSTLKR